MLNLLKVQFFGEMLNLVKVHFGVPLTVID